MAIIDYLLRQTYFEQKRGVLSLFKKDSNALLLDCGCGDGSFTREVANVIGAKDIYGIDIMRSNVLKANDRGIKAVLGDLDDYILFDDDSFDVIMANQVIEHLKHTDKFIKEIYRVLKRGGYVVVSTPNLASFHNSLYLLWGRQPYWVDVSNEVKVNTWHPLKSRTVAIDNGMPSHNRAFTLGALQELMEYYGFVKEKAIGAGFYPLPALLARLLCMVDGKHAVIAVVKARK